MILGAAIAPVSALGERPAELLVVLAALAVMPVALVTLTSFLKMAVVLSVVRSALGAPQIPPNTAVTGLALALTFIVMNPTGEAALDAARAAPAGSGVGAIVATATAASEPLRQFLVRFARADDRRTFHELARRASGAAPRPVADTDFVVLMPSFLISELRRAFTMGFLVFLPFLVVDLLVANVLLALGLTQLSPTTVALPFKLLLFVAADGWKLLARGLVLGYLA